MYNFIVILILIVSVLLAIVVLVQNSKGADLPRIFRLRTKLWVFARPPIFWRKPHGPLLPH